MSVMKILTTANTCVATHSVDSSAIVVTDTHSNTATDVLVSIVVWIYQLLE